MINGKSYYSPMFSTMKMGKRAEPGVIMPAFWLPLQRSSRKGTVALFGEVLADIFPDRTVLGGAPFNVARHLKAFGQNPLLITRLGHDALHDEVMSTLSQCKMETLGVQCGNSYPTGQVWVHIEKGGHRFEILPEQAYDFIHHAAVRMAALSARPDLVYFGTLAQRHDVSRNALKVLLKSTRSAKFLDINLRAPWYDETTLRQSLESADIVKLNHEELQVLADMFGLSEVSPQDQARKLMVQFNLRQIIVTCGEAGAWLAGHDGKIIEAAAKHPAGKLVDTVGAGDGFAAVCILGILLHWPVSVTLERANSFAAAICGIRGAAPDHADFYKLFTEEWSL